MDTRDVSPTDVLADDGRVPGFHQAVVAAVAWTAPGLLDEKVAEQLDHGLVDQLRAVAGAEVEEKERELGRHLPEQRGKPGLGNVRRSHHHLPLGPLIDGVDVIESIALGPPLWWTLSRRRDPGWPLGSGLRQSPIWTAVGRSSRRCASAGGIGPSGAGCRGDRWRSGQALELSLAVDLELALENVPRGRAVQPLVGFIDSGQQSHVGLPVAAREAGRCEGFDYTR
jgi:hypothetical protein